MSKDNEILNTMLLQKIAELTEQLDASSAENSYQKDTITLLEAQVASLKGMLNLHESSKETSKAGDAMLSNKYSERSDRMFTFANAQKNDIEAPEAVNTTAPAA